MKMFQTLTSSSSGFFSSRSSFSPISTSTSFRVSPRFLKRAGSPLAVLLQTNNFKELLFRSARSSNYLIALLTLQPHSTVIFAATLGIAGKTCISAIQGRKRNYSQLNLTIFCVLILKSRKTPLQC